MGNLKSERQIGFKKSKTFYLYIKNKRVTKEKVGSLKIRGGSFCLESEDIDKEMNEYVAELS